MLQKCVVCESEVPFRKIFQKKGKDYVRCTDCGIIVVAPIPSRTEMTDYYNADYAHDSGMGTARTDAEALFQATAQSRLPEIEAIVPDGRWLDVGCANGAFLEVIAAAGYDAHGIDLSDTAADFARAKGLQVRAAAIEDCVLDSPYDVISAFDVIEHVIDPSEFIRNVSELLKPGGVLVLTTPDTRSVMARMMGSRWYEYIPETHFFNFHADNLRRLLHRFGLEVMEVGRAYKFLSYDYSMIQFKAYNPLIYKVLGTIRFMLPRSARQYPIRLYIGEVSLIARKAP